MTTLNHTPLNHEVDEEGATPPLMLLHALGADLRMWDACRALWKGHLQSVSYDRSGAGKSTTPNREYTLDDHVIELEELRSALGIEAMVPVGNAIGALVAALYAARHPERVPGLVLCDPAVARSSGTSSMLEERIAKVTAGGMAAILPGAVDRAFHEQPHDERYEAYLARFGAQDPVAYAHSMRSSSGADLRAAYDAITCPVLIIVGEHDLLFPPTAAEEVAALLPDVELHVLDGVAHFPPYQDPDRVAALISDFAASLQARGGGPQPPDRT